MTSITVKESKDGEHQATIEAKHITEVEFCRDLTVIANAALDALKEHCDKPHLKMFYHLAMLEIVSKIDDDVRKGD